ncbi:MAG: histidine kinase [Pseudomonadota bacterium]|nr:histidine kinase [Pseudomonadota bacterium]
MRACSLESEKQFDLSLAANTADAKMVSRMRLVLAIAVLLAVFIDPAGLSSVNRLTWLVLFGYLAHSSVVYVYSQLDNLLLQSRLVHRLDVLWFAAIVGFTGGVNSLFFLLFFFAILVSSFRWGLEEGARMTMASAVLFALSGLLLETGNELPRLLLRTTFLLALGYMCVRWGESKVRLMRQLALLRDVSRLSNPRFGVDHTITSILKKSCVFFNASSCILVMQDKESGVYFLRTVRDDDASPCLHAEKIDATVASPFMDFSEHQVIVYNHPQWSAMAFVLEESLACDTEGQHWRRQGVEPAKRLAEMMDACSFISAPVLLRKQQGRIYAVSKKMTFDKADALFISHMAAQAFPVLESIELLDKMASEAALQERKKMSLDLHDTAIQPYIGLKLGLGALRNKASTDNPLLPEIDKLMSMAEKVISDLRHYAMNFKTVSRSLEPIFLMVLRQQADQFREFYGVDVDISMSHEIVVSDRLSAEVLQMVREGLANICKHTLAQRGSIKIDCINGWLSIQIENESLGSCIEVADFVPRSLSERAAGLGGNVHVMQIPQGNTVVHVEIPV